MCSNDEFFGELLRIGEGTATGQSILGTIRDPQQHIDIPIAPILSYTYSTGFVPDVPGVVFNFGTGGYFPSADPKPVRATILLFHELGHAVQWIQDRGWCERQMSVRSRGGFNEVIERDNLVRHEWPLCKELGHPTRMRYTDMFDSPAEAKERFDTTTQAATIIQSAVRGFLVRRSMTK